VTESNIISTFMRGGSFYKGNLHCHSTLSDGSLEPDEVVRRYKEAGYAFLGLSDHNRYFNTTEYDTDEFIMIPAIEWTVREPKDGIKGHHIHGIWGTSKMIEKAKSEDKIIPHLKTFKPWIWEGTHTVQKCVDYLRDSGNLAIYNHPIWSRLELDDLLNTEFFGLEIFNYDCEVGDGTELATLYWDQLLRRGRKVFGFASDDAHLGMPVDSPYYSTFGGWIVVIAKELTREALAEAMVQGSFYSSSGPEIFEYDIDGEEIVVRCSPVDRIHFIAYERRGRTFRTTAGETISEARYHMHGDETFVRVECIDGRGRVAWTNPIFVKERF
jgi:hypothetical protein